MYNEAIDILLLCRKRLMNSYIFAFYLIESNRAIFEINQRYLECAVEEMVLELEILSNDFSKKVSASLKDKIK